MLVKDYPLWTTEQYPFPLMPNLRIYTSDAPDAKPAVLVLPGGAYYLVSEREDEPMALAYAQAGFNVCVLTYTVRGESLPPIGTQPLKDAARAIELMRLHAGEWKLVPDKIAICGFSAGGHLAASLSVFGDSAYLQSVYSAQTSTRPNASILIYPVISGSNYLHSGSFKNLFGDEPNELYDHFSLECRVDAQTPPTFLMHAADDMGVRVENSLLYATALSKHGVPFSMHIYEQGGHGTSTSDFLLNQLDKNPVTPVMTHSASWVPLSVEWLRMRFGMV